jgi:predicted pyridoxine 5'-phosphate oxidase superfamily flavin-nucleotide-binding protein
MTTSPIPGWPHSESPFHEGERAVQQRLGIMEKMEAAGRRVIRDYMPEQHREFFTQLPFVLVGSLDANDQPWASVLYGAPGFLATPDSTHLEVRGCLPLADPLHDTIAPQATLGLLGIQPHTRRRNRMNGTVEWVKNGHFGLRVNRSFGNCPKYIQAREPHLSGNDDSMPSMRRAASLDKKMQRLVATADTFFIATAIVQEVGPPTRPHGADVSHRGGKPGFVRIDDAITLTVPDFIGNFFFNTLGNIVAHPRAGLLFIDFDNGDLLYLATDAHIVWEGDDVAAFEGAQRLLRFTIRSAMLVERGLPLRWSKAELSPALVATGVWPAIPQQ